MPRATHVLMRGAYDQKERAWPGPPVLPALPAGAPPNRLGLARWIADPGHPHGGRGGQSPAAARLRPRRDARGLRARGAAEPPEPRPAGRRVRCQRLGHEGPGAARFRDLGHRRAHRPWPSATCNRLLARGPRFRLQAEHIRDLALASSGLLVPQVGGRARGPTSSTGFGGDEPQHPATEQVYVQDHGDGLYRRGMYTIWRTVPPDDHGRLRRAQPRDVIRRRGPTPRQASRAQRTGFVEAMRALAQRVLEGGETSAAALHLFRYPRASRARGAGRPGRGPRAGARALRGEPGGGGLSVGRAPGATPSPRPSTRPDAGPRTVLNLSEAVTRG